MGFEPEDKRTAENPLDIQFEGGGADVDGNDFADSPTVSASRINRRTVKARAAGGQANFSNDPEERAARIAENHNPPPVRRPLMRSSSEFGYLFSDDEPVDNHMDDQHSRRLDALAYDGSSQNEEQYSDMLEGEQPSMVRRPENRISAEDALSRIQRSNASDSTRRRQRFARRSKSESTADVFVEADKTPAAELYAREEPAEQPPAQPAESPVVELVPMYEEKKRPRRNSYYDDPYRDRRPSPYDDDHRDPRYAGYDMPRDAYPPYPVYPPYPYPYGYQPPYPVYPPYPQYPGYPPYPYPPAGYPPYGYPVQPGAYPPVTAVPSEIPVVTAEPAPAPAAAPVVPAEPEPVQAAEESAPAAKEEEPQIDLPHPPASSAGRHSLLVSERFAAMQEEPKEETKPERMPEPQPASDDFFADAAPSRQESPGSGRFNRRSRVSSGQNGTPASTAPSGSDSSPSGSADDWFSDSGSTPSSNSGSAGSAGSGERSSRFNRRSR